MSAVAVMELELRRLIVRPLGWLLGALALAELGWRFVLLLGNFLASQIRLAALPSAPGFTDLVAVPELSSLFTGGFVPFGVVELALLIVPLLTMGTLAGERGQGTLPLLFSSGAPAWRVVLGKYAAVLIWLTLWLALVLLMPLSLAHGTTLDWGKLGSAALGTWLLLALLAAIGVACSSYASHPAMAAATTLVIALGLASVNLGAQAMGAHSGALDWLALGTHLEPLLRGLVDTADIAWFVLLTALALALAVRRLGSERSRN